MSIFTALTTAYSMEDAFKAKDVTSQEMRRAIAEWFRLYYEQEATKDRDPCQRIAYTVVNKLTKTCFGEYSASSKDEFAQSVLEALGKSKNRAMQLTLAGGEAFLKPVPMPDGWMFHVVRRDNVLVFGRSVVGAPTDIGTIERTTHGSSYYTLLERRNVDGTGRLTIRNMLYKSEMDGQLGQQIALGSLPEYAKLLPEYTYTVPLGGLGMVHMRVPIENVVDGSQDGVSVYAAAVGLIRNIDRNEAQINGEFERSRSKVFASADLLKQGDDGTRHVDDDVFVGLDDNPDEIGMTIFSPTIREQSFLARKQEYLRNVETIIGIKRGLLSEVEAQERTAKEITSSEGDYNLTITDLQQMWERAVRDVIKLCGIMGKLYRVPGAHEVAEDAVTIDWGNGVLFDEDKTWAGYLDLVARGMLKPEIALGWRFGMPTDTEDDLKKIRKKYMPVIEKMIGNGEE